MWEELNLSVDTEDWYQVFLAVLCSNTWVELQEAIEDLDLPVYESVANKNNIPY